MLDKNSESQVHVEAIEGPPPGKSIALGLERMGMIAVKAPILSLIVLAVLIVGALFGINRIKIDDSLSQLFRSDSKDYKQYEAVTKRFPATGFAGTRRSSVMLKSRRALRLATEPRSWPNRD